MNAALRPEDMSATLPPSAAAAGALHGALLESRQRWQDLAGLAADFVFEADGAGRFTFLWPDRVLGHAATRLLGRRAASLLLGTGPDPFELRQAVRRQRYWMAGSGGEPRCVLLSLVPLADARGNVTGLRGTAHDVTDQEHAATAAAAGLRRAALLDALADKVRLAATARDSLAQGLAGLRDALGCAGTAMIVPGADGPSTVAETAEVPAAMLAAVAEGLVAGTDWTGTLEAGGPAALLHHHGRPLATSVLVAWRDRGARDWDAEDLAVLRSMAAMLGAVLGFGRIQEELERQATTDPLTGLANRRAFLGALAAALDTGTAAQAGALLFLDLDNLKPLNDRYGHDAGDAALRSTADLLHAAGGPDGLAARFGGDEFVLWLPGADATAAIATAERLLGGAAALPQDGRSPHFSIGIAWRGAGSAEHAAGLVARADTALYDAKRAGRGGWRMAEPAP
jgi:diguanylate cyclase (GGDEF)-like protein